MEENNLPEKLREALVKRALGFTLEEKSEEYQLVDGDMALIKRKVSQKEIPPELTAIKMLTESTGDPYAHLDEKELEKEKERLLKSLAAIGKKDKRV